MKKHIFISSALFALCATVYAQGNSPQQHGADNSKQISARYADDKKLCAEESNSSTRMQCLRDAKEEYDKSLASAKSDSSSNKSNNKGNHACAECGKIIAVDIQDKKGEGSALGVIAGGVVGGLLGNQVGGGTGRSLATIAGAAGGAYAGNKVEANMKTSKIWVVSVHYDNDSKNTYEFDHDPGYRVGELIRRNGNGIEKR
ncbi:glycine zipper 2TM domain-containing protein [Undibacterium sp.]|uniref:glycine zipper 2TM domain-containing protein n=1 Tax=Undibacterium sp. TaxID=1914977 RepID=UPI0026002CD9|nr:glycine zipper 2TM domain-containing protein [Undibacterium sp.]